MTSGILAIQCTLTVVNAGHYGVKFRRPPVMILQNYGLCPSGEVMKFRYAGPKKRWIQLLTMLE
jgi:hypothetical protein